MAKIKIIPFLRHVRSDSSRHVILYKRGVARRSGRGLAFWFLPLSSSVMEIPIDDREVPSLFHARSRDFQDVTTQGAITYRVTNAEALASRVDFTIDSWTGEYLERPLERLADVFVQQPQRIGAEYVTTTPVRQALSEGQREIRTRLETILRADEALAMMGLEVVAVEITSVAPGP